MTFHRRLALTALGVTLLTPPASTSGSTLGVQVTGTGGAEAAGTGWKLGALDLDVVAHPDSQTVRVAGRLAATAPIGGSRGPDLVLGPGGMRFESVASDGAVVELNAARDTARVRLDRVANAGRDMVIRFALRATQPRIARSVALGAEGGFASYFGNWYPWLAAAKGSEPGFRAPGTLTLTIPSAWRGLSNGRLVDSSSSGGLRRERWVSLTTLGWSFIAAPYHVTRHRVDSIDVAIYLMPRQAARAPAFAAAIPPMVRILERAYGPYPFATFGLAAIPAGIAPPQIGGRSEMGYFLTHEHALDGDSVDVPIFAHELAHMWWANTVISDPPGDDMVDEAMASYGATLVVESRHGRDAAREYMRDGSVPNSAHTFFHLWRIGGDLRLMSDFATLPSYSKGAWVYEMLRERVGDSIFFATLKQLVRERAGRSTTMNDIRAAFVRAAPPSADLERFFADWLERTGAPVITVRWETATLAGRPAARATLVQHTTPYRLPLELEVTSRAGALRTHVLLADSVQSFVLPARGTPTGVRLDPDHHVMLWEPSFGPIRGVTPPMSPKAERAWLDEDLRWLQRLYGAKRFDIGLVRGREVEWRSISAGEMTSGTRSTGDDSLAWTLGELALAARRIDPAAFPASRPQAGIRALTELWASVLASASAPAEITSPVIREITTRGDSVASDPLGATERGGLGFRLATKRGAERLSFVDVRDSRTIVLIGYPASRAGAVIAIDDDRSAVGLAIQIAQRLAMVERWPEYPAQD